MKNLLLAVLLVFSVAQARADFLIEPLIGYTIAGDVGEATKYDASGAGFGARVGFQTLGLMAGLDYQSNSLTLDTTPTETDADSTEIGLFVGYEFPILLRVWGAYMVSGEADFGASGKYKGLSGTKFGIGWTGLPFLCINLEFKSYEYDEDEPGATLNPAAEYTATMLSVSLPLTF